MMNLTMRPTMLVALSTKVEAGITYQRTDIAATDDGTVTKWETVKLVPDPLELERANSAVSSAAGLIRKITTRTSFCRLCPIDREAELVAADEEAQKIVKAFNETPGGKARIRVYMMKAKMESDEVRAANAVAADMREIVAEMNEAAEKLDPDRLREAAKAAKQMMGVLSDDKQAIAGRAIEAARKVANTIAKRVTREGEKAEVVMKDLRKELDAVSYARTSFLDMSPAIEVAGEQLPAVDMARFAELDAQPACAPIAEPAPADAAPEIDTTPAIAPAAEPAATTPEIDMGTTAKDDAPAIEAAPADAPAGGA